MTAVVLRCTEKLLRLLGSRPSGAKELDPRETEWYANLLWLDARKCVLFTHADTLFSFLVPDVRKADEISIGELFVDRLEFELATEEVAIDAFGWVDPAAVRIARTTSRSVLGSMNDLAHYCREVVGERGGLASTNIEELNAKLRRTPLSAIGYRYPIDLVRLNPLP